MIINHNLASLNTLNALGKNEKATQSSLAKLSSGLRINTAADDAAGLAISEKMRGQIRGLDQAKNNASNAISLVQTAEGALNETTSILQRMRELAVQSSSDTNTDSDRQQLQAEVSQLQTEIDRIGNTTEFNTKKLLDGSAKGVTSAVDGSIQINNNSSVSVSMSSAVANTGLKGALVDGAYMLVKVSQAAASGTFAATDFKIVGTDGKVSSDITFTAGTTLTLGTNIVAGGLTIRLSADAGKNMKVGETITLAFSKHINASSTLANSVTLQICANAGQTANLSIGDMRAKAIGVDKIDISTKYGAMASIATIDVATAKVSAQRASLGAVQNRLEHTINNLSTSSENLTSAESTVRDVDMAKEMANYQKNSVLQQAAQAMLAQANQQPSQVLKLLQ